MYRIGCTADTSSHNSWQLNHDMQDLQAVLQRLLSMSVSQYEIPSMSRTLLFNENI